MIKKVTKTKKGTSIKLIVERKAHTAPKIEQEIMQDDGESIHTNEWQHMGFFYQNYTYEKVKSVSRIGSASNRNFLIFQAKQIHVFQKYQS